MKRKVLCFFSLLLILLVFFTIVSPKVEDEMYTLVDARKGEGKGNRNLSVGTIAIVWENSNDRLFNIVEGDGWESGLRLAEIPSAYFDRYESHVELGAGTEYWYVYSASREPVLGSAVSVVETKRGEDIYLLWHPETIPALDRLPNSMDVIAHEGNAALISNWGATFPFFEHNIWYTLRNQIGRDARVYSLHDVQQLTQALPWITGVIAALCCSIVLWGASWIFSDKIGCRKSTLVINTLLIGVLMSALPLLLNRFDLPASLMPQESILDIPHYIETFHRITASMDSMGDPTVREWLSQASTDCKAIAGLSVVMISTIVTVEGILCHRRSKAVLEDNED